MPLFPRITVLAVVVASAVLLSGCLAPDPDPTPSPSPSASPVFASEEEALAAATEAYAAYQAMSDVITSERGEAPERIRAFVTEDYESAEYAGFMSLREAGLATRGASTFDSVSIQQLPNNLSVGGIFTVYLCSDISAVELLDSNGNIVTPEDRPNRLPLELDFELKTERPVELLIDRSDVWAGDNFC